MGLCCSNEKDVNTGCLKLPTAAAHDRHHHHPSALSPNGKYRSESNATTTKSQQQVRAVSGAAAGQKQLLFGMLVHDSRSSPADGGGTAQQMKALEKMMAEIDACGFKIIAQSCSNSKASTAAAAAEAGSGSQKDTCLHVQLRNDAAGGCRNCSTAHACSKKSTIEILDQRKKNETFISANQTKTVALPTNSGIKMGWISVLDSAKAIKHSDSSIVQLKNEASKLEAVHSEGDETPMKNCSAQVGATTAVRKIQQNCEKKESTLYTDARSPYRRKCSFSLEQEGEEISIFSADKYFCEEDDAERNGKDSHSTETLTGSGFCFQIESVKSGRAVHHTKPKNSIDLEYNGSTTSESDLWGSSMKDGESLARFRKNNLEKIGSTKGTSTTSFSTDGSSAGRWHEDSLLLGGEHRFVEEGRKPEKQLGKSQHPSRVQWHLAKVNSHEFVMSPSSLANTYARPHLIKEDQHFGDMKQEAAGAVESVEDYCNAALEVAIARDEFSFDPFSGSCELTPQGMQNHHVQAAAAIPPAASHDQNDQEADSEYLKFSWESPFYAHRHKNSTAGFVDMDEAAVSVKTESSSPDFLVDHKKECDAPSLIRSYSDLTTAKLYHSTGYLPNKHGRNESDDYHSDMSTDLFEIDRLEVPSCVSSPTYSPKTSLRTTHNSNRATEASST